MFFFRVYTDPWIWEKNQKSIIESPHLGGARAGDQARSRPFLAIPDRCRTCGKPQSGLGDTRIEPRGTGGYLDF